MPVMGQRWADNITYWAVDLPEPAPSLNASITASDDKQYLEYDISCLEKVEGPQEFIDYLDTYGKLPRGRVRLTSPTPLTYVLKGWDADGRDVTPFLALFEHHHPGDFAARPPEDPDVTPRHPRPDATTGRETPKGGAPNRGRRLRCGTSDDPTRNRQPRVGLRDQALAALAAFS
jgi:hypothetical protein